HTPYKDLGHHLDKLIAYSRMSAADLDARGRRASFSDVALRPALRFWRDYVLHGSIFDGRLGVIHAGMSAAAVFFKYAFLWERQGGRRSYDFSPDRRISADADRHRPHDGRGHAPLSARRAARLDRPASRLAGFGRALRRGRGRSDAGAEQGAAQSRRSVVLVAACRQPRPPAQAALRLV